MGMVGDMSDNLDQDLLSKLDASLSDVDQAKRDTLRKLIVGTAFAVPAVMSFSVDGLLVSSARASVANQTAS